MSELNIHKPIKWLGEQANWKGDNPFVSLTNYKIQNLGFQFTLDSSEKAIKQVVSDILDYRVTSLMAKI